MSPSKNKLGGLEQILSTAIKSITDILWVQSVSAMGLLCPPFGVSFQAQRLLPSSAACFPELPWRGAGGEWLPLACWLC